MIRGLPRGALLASTVLGLPIGLAAPALAQSAHFERIATYPVYLNLPEGADPATETVAEIVSATDDGMMLIYTDGEGDALGMVDIADPAAPQGAGRVDLGGEPTSVDAHGAMAYAGVNTAESYVEPSGHVAVIDMAAGVVQVLGEGAAADDCRKYGYEDPDATYHQFHEAPTDSRGFSSEIPIPSGSSCRCEPSIYTTALRISTVRSPKRYSNPVPKSIR